MKESPRKTLNRLKRNIIELEAQKISEGLESSNDVIVVATLNELKRLKDPFHMHKGMVFLSSSSDDVIIAALKYLNAVEHPLSLEEITPLLKRGMKIRREVAKIARLMEYSQACEILKKLIKDHLAEVKIAAMRTISEIGCEKLLKDVEEVANDVNPKVSVVAIGTLAELGGDVEGKLLTEIVSNASLPDKIRIEALKVYVKNSIGPLKFLKEIATSSHPALSSKALELMGEMKCDEVWDTLENVLSDSKNIPLRICAALSALKSCKDKTEVEDVAIGYLTHPSLKVKISAFKTVMKTENIRAVEFVNDFLKSENSELIKVAVPFVYKYPDEDNVQMLKKMVEEGNEKAIISALKVLKKLKLRNESASKYLDRNYPINVRTQALRTLAAVNDIFDEDLKGIVTSSEPLEFRIAALDGLATIAPEKLLELEES